MMAVLTPRQAELVALYASGYTVRQIAEIKFLSVRSVEDTFARARESNNAKTLANLCVICLDAGLIERNGVGYVPVYDPEVVGE